MQLPPPASPEIRRLAQALGVTVTFANVLARRGFGDNATTRSFLDPKLASLTPPQDMVDRAAAIDRIVFAIRRRERVTLFGDYDCDGITSVAILTEVLRRLGGQVTPLLANRFVGGYGLNDAAADAVLQAKPSLLITCDCGSSDRARLDRLASHGVEAVVIDHHLVPDEPLGVRAFLNPRRPDCGFSYKNLASCGLSLNLAAGLRAELDPSIDIRAWLDLVAVGTVADVVPLDGDNRALVRAGMRVLERGQRPGLAALAELARTDLSAGVSSETIAFEIAPRLNAPGRLGDPRPALELLLAADLSVARTCAARVEAARNERRSIQDQILAEALLDIEARGDETAPAIVLGRPGWHHGIVGIVAAQIVDRFHKPTVIVGFDGSTGRGSVRGPAGISVYDLLVESRDALAAFGGHHAAAGVTLDLSALDRFREMFVDAARRAFDRMPLPERDAAAADVRLDPADSPAAVVRDLVWLEPCGQGNEAPCFGVEAATVTRARSVRGGHLQVELAVGGATLYGFGRSMGRLANELRVGARVSATGTIRRDTFRGNGAVGLYLRAIETT